MKISVIIPVLHERERINETIASVKSVAEDIPYEIIVVDGDPSGSTIEKITDKGIQAISALRGRALQMNAGAKCARGDILLFLHADTLLPAKALVKIVKALSDQHYIGGAFDLGIQNGRWIFRAISRAASLKHRITRVPYGDQAIFIQRGYFKSIGGYACIPLMEDVELMRRVKRHGGHIIILPEAVKTSSRKWETEGIIYTVIRNWVVQTLYLFGMPAEKLVQCYYKES